MEEQKKQNLGELKGKGTERKQPGQQRMSYEDLNKTCMQLSQSNQQMQAYINKLHMQMEDMNQTNMFQRLNYLFKVVEFSSSFSPNFAAACVNEIEEMMTIPEEVKNPQAQPKEAKEQPKSE